MFLKVTFSALAIQSTIGNECWLLALNFLLDMYTSSRIFNKLIFLLLGVSGGS